MKKVIAACFVSVLLIHETAFSTGRRDVESLTVLEDGTYEVLCRDGRTQNISEEDFLNDQVCLPVPEESNNILCGNYAENIALSGINIITCNTTFSGNVSISAGTKILADDFWTLRFEKEITSGGTPEKPVVFGLSDNSLSDSWKEINFGSYNSPALAYDLQNGYTSGNLLSHTEIVKSERITGLHVFVENSTITATTKIRFTESYVSKSDLISKFFDFDLEYPGSYAPTKSYVLFSKLKSPDQGTAKIDADQTMFGWNEFMTPVLLNFIDYSSFFAFNTFKEISTIAHINHASYYANLIKRGLSQIEEERGSHNTEDSLTDITLVIPFIFRRSYSADTDENIEMFFVAANKDNFLFDAELRTSAYYHIDGTEYRYNQIWTGFNPALSFSSREAYTLRFRIPGLDDASLVYPDVKINVW